MVELVPAAPPRADDTQLRDAVVEHLAAHPDLSAADLAAALDAEPRHVKRALTALVVEERVVASGKGRGMRYRLVGEEPVVELVPVAPPRPAEASAPREETPTALEPPESEPEGSARPVVHDEVGTPSSPAVEEGRVAESTPEEEVTPDARLEAVDAEEPVATEPR